MQAEGHIRPQAQGRGGQLFLAKGHPKGPVQQPQHAGGVGAAPRHARAHGDDLFDIDMQAGIFNAAGLKKGVGRLHRQVAVIRGQIGQVAPQGNAPLPVQRKGHQVAQVNGLEHGLQLVIAVGPQAPDAQIQIQFGKRRSVEGLHSLSP